MRTHKTVLIVLDGVGVGALPDAAHYGDVGANTLRHTVEQARPSLPHLRALGLGNVQDTGLAPVHAPLAAFGRCVQRSAGKDTTTGHWEIAGLTLAQPFPTYPDGFPPAVIEAFERAIGRGTLGNVAASGTAILDALGEAHMQTGKPIVYTSADSVFQIAAHEAIIPPPALYAMCETARAQLTGAHGVGRVIARPFVGTHKGAFSRTGNRRDFSLTPPRDTLLDVLLRAGLETVGIGKIEDIFAHRGLTHSDHASGNAACIEAMCTAFAAMQSGLLFVNLVDTDMLFGHRRDVPGFAGALSAFDAALPRLLAMLAQNDVLIITADHGCDPAFTGTDHTREYVPLLVYGKRIAAGRDLGTRETFGDIAATVLSLYGLPQTLDGTSFAEELA